LAVTKTRALNIGCVLVFAAVTTAQTATTQAPPLPGLSSARPEGNLAELMRGIMFPNSNIIFNVQYYDPAEAKPGYEPGTKPFSWLEWGATIYTGWEVVEYAAIALGEAPDLILKPGRLCTNGKPVPVEREDFRKAAQGLRDVSSAVLKAVREKNQEKVADLTNQLADACVACHVTYRNTPPGGPLRCVARN
jgi:hypothetical protein